MPAIPKTQDRPIQTEYDPFEGVYEYWAGRDKLAKLEQGLAQEKKEFTEDPGNYIMETAANLAGGAVHGLGEIARAAEYLSQTTNPIQTLVSSISAGGYTPPSDMISQPIKEAGMSMAEDVSGPAFATGDILGPPVASVLRNAPRAAGAVMDGIDTVGSKLTKPIMDKATDLITGESKRGSAADWIKSGLVQDYRLGENYKGYLDVAETGIRDADKAIDMNMGEIASRLTASEKNSLNRYLDGKMTENEFDEVIKVAGAEGSPLADAMNFYKTKIKDVGDELVNLNMIEKNDPHYLKNVFTEENHVKKNIFKNNDINEKRVYNNAQSSGLKVNLHETENHQSYLDAGFRDTGKTTADGKHIYNRDYSEQELKDMGASDDIASRVGATIESQETKRIKGNFFKSVADDGKIAYDKPLRDGDVRLDGNQYGQLDGKYVSKEVKYSIDLFADKSEKIVPEGWRKFVNEWKTNTVIKNPKSHMNNIIGNVALSWYSGVPMMDSLKSAMNTAGVAARTIKSPTQANAYMKSQQGYNEAKEAGLFGRTSIDEMVNQVTGIESRFKPQNLPGNLNKSNMYIGKDSKVGSRFYESYKLEDDMFKLSNYNYWRKQGLDPKAARVKVEQAVFDYAKQMPKGLNFARDTGLIPFVSFQYKSIPLLADTLANRPGKIGATMATLYGINALFDGDKELGEGQTRVGSKNISTGQWTPYMEYLKPQDTASSYLFGGVPQNIAGAMAGKNMSFGKPRAISRQGDEPLDTAGKYAKKLFMDIAPVPAVYKAGYRTIEDVMKGKSAGQSAVDRLIMGIKDPKKKSRSRTPSRSRSREER